MRPRLRSGVLARSPAFRALFVARAVSLVGDGIGTVALVVHVQRVEGSGAAVGFLLLAASLPRLLSPVAGSIVDRVDRRTALVGGEVGQAVALALVAVWLPPLPLLLVLLVAKSAVATVADPAGQSAIAALVADDDLPAANGLIGGAREAGETLGPLLGGVLVALAGVRAGLAVDTLSFVVTAPLLLRVPRLPPATVDDGARRSAASVRSDALAGLRYTLEHPVARALFVAFFLVGLSAADDIALPFLARSLGAGARGIGGLYAAVGAGLVVGYVVVARRGGRGRAAQALALGGAVAAGGNALTGAAPVLLVAVLFQVTRGVGTAVFETALQTLLQRTVPAPFLGRVFANVYGAVHVAACVALLGGGLLVDATSPRAVLVLSGCAGGAAVLAAARLLRPL
jgi:MFS family permease